MCKLIILLFALTALAMKCEAKIFTRCELVYELMRQNFVLADLENWVCLIEAESSRNTAAIGKNHNGSRDWGLFQINDGYWCSNTTVPGKDCHVLCTDLITDDITAASTCAHLIFNLHSFDAWYGWLNKCKDKPLPDISTC